MRRRAGAVAAFAGAATAWPAEARRAISPAGSRSPCARAQAR